MSLSNASLAEINALHYGNIIFYQFWSYLLVCLGTVGHSLNIYVFTRPILRSNPCTRYFLATAIAERTHPGLLLLLLSIGRFLCSSPSATLRGWSSLRVASRAILFVIVVVALFYLYVPIQYENILMSTKCSPTQSTDPLFTGIWNLLIFSLGPSIVMLSFGLLTFRHVQQSGKRMVPQSNQVQNQTESITPQQDQLRRKKKTDRQLLQMILVQSVYFSLLSTPVSVWYIYTALRINVVPDALQSAKDTLFGNVTGLLSITGACTSFYFFTLSSQLFRRELIQLFKCQWRPNQTIPTSTELRQRN
ncbi:unnamed protein product [Adineta steineri]|uniref:G-protein coupled receptors family 1 profile domain-containing protein n=1 Tax=Adineta steineri TaxID=433720 RepID=A0A819YSN6_9BILA|nr:unnamed protein product [Adineta steineri]